VHVATCSRAHSSLIVHILLERLAEDLAHDAEARCVGALVCAGTSMVEQLCAAVARTEHARRQRTTIARQGRYARVLARRTAVPERFFALLQGEDLLVDRALGHHAYDAHRARLADPVGTVLSLQVELRVPIEVVDDDRVCAGQVDALPTRARGEEEGEDLVGGLVGLDQLLALGDGGRAVEA
jgi:hypothetical protein